MNFLVKVACAAHLTSCPISSPVEKEFVAKDQADCYAKVENMIAQFKYKSRDFKIQCRQK